MTNHMHSTDMILYTVLSQNFHFCCFRAMA